MDCPVRFLAAYIKFPNRQGWLLTHNLYDLRINFILPRKHREERNSDCGHDEETWSVYSLHRWNQCSPNTTSHAVIVFFNFLPGLPKHQSHCFNQQSDRHGDAAQARR